MKRSSKNKKNKPFAQTNTEKGQLSEEKTISLEKNIKEVEKTIKESRKITDKKDLVKKDSSSKWNQESEKALVKTKLILVASFVFLGFLFSFLTGYAHFNISKAFSYGCIGAASGYIIGMIPYLLIHKKSL